MKLRYLIATALTTVGCALGANAQESIEGYFRVQSALGSSSNSGYVEVRGPFTTAPDLSKEEALTSAGTVMRLRAFPEKQNGKVVRYKIGNLSSQGIEVFGAPKSNYLDVLQNEIINYINISDFEATAYGLQRYAREAGYIATGRVIIESLFWIVADRLDKEIANLSDDVKAQLGYDASMGTLADFADRFNTEVSEKLDLHAYLEPVADGQYRLCFNWIDCTTASEFYLKEENKTMFEVGFECMRQYMNGKEGLGSGELIDAKEAALWRAWGYDIDTKYADLKDSEGTYHMTYEKIFADHEVLYNWLKMYIERFLDPEKAPDAEIMGINFKSFAEEMQRHEIMRGFLAYIPSIQEGQKLYLTSGRFSDGVNDFSTVGTDSDGAERFGLLGESQALAAGDAAVWNVIPMDLTDNYFAIEPVAHRENSPSGSDAHYLAYYLDFPIKAVNTDKVKFYNLDGSMTLGNSSLTNLGQIEFIQLDEELTQVNRLASVLVKTETETLTDNIVEIIYETQASDYNPSTEDEEEATDPDLIVSDEVVNKQHAPSRASADSALSYGVLLATNADAKSLKNLWGIEADMSQNAVYDLTTREGKTSASTNQAMRTPWFQETGTIPANHSFVIARSDNRAEPGISLEEPADEKRVLTSVENINADKMERDIIYDLSGRKVNEAHHGGIYILNGKKILVK